MLTGGRRLLGKKRVYEGLSRRIAIVRALGIRRASAITECLSILSCSSKSLNYRIAGEELGDRQSVVQLVGCSLNSADSSSIQPCLPNAPLTGHSL